MLNLTIVVLILLKLNKKDLNMLKHTFLQIKCINNLVISFFILSLQGENELVLSLPPR